MKGQHYITAATLTDAQRDQRVEELDTVGPCASLLV